MNTERNPDPATRDLDSIDGCVTGTFTRDYAWRSHSTSYVTVEFVADGLAFEGRWVVFRNPAFFQTLCFSGLPSSRPEVKSYRGLHCIASSRVREITYDHADCVPWAPTTTGSAAKEA